MANDEPLHDIISNLEEGISKKKCQQCGCMEDALEELTTDFRGELDAELVELATQAKKKMTKIKYSCLGCKYCYAAEIQNNLVDLNVIDNSDRRDFVVTSSWPPVMGEYYTFCDGDTCPVAVSTLGSLDLIDELIDDPEPGLCIIGKTETENIGIDKIIKNVVSNPTIRTLIVAGKETKGHRPGHTLIALSNNGVDEARKVKGSVGRRPVLRNVSVGEIDRFRQQVEMVDMIGCEDQLLIRQEIKRRTRNNIQSDRRTDEDLPLQLASPHVIQAEEDLRIKLDKRGYFVIVADRKRKVMHVEYYSYDHTLIGVVEGKDARSIYLTILKKEWVSLLSHAAYLGKELERAELSMKYDFDYVQDEG